MAVKLMNKELEKIVSGDKVTSFSAYVKLQSMTYEAKNEFSAEDLMMRLSSIMQFAKNYYEEGKVTRGELYVLRVCTSEELDCFGYGDLKQYVFRAIDYLI